MGLVVGTENSGFTPRGQGSFKLPFQEQIDFFNAKNTLATQHWDDILTSAHDKAFIVAGAAKADLLNDLQSAVKTTINEGKTLDWFRGQFDAIVKKHGWTGWTGEGTDAGVAWRTKVIYQTNLSTSYAAGRWQQLNDPDLLKVRPYWKYIHNDAQAHPRPLHQSWNGTVLPHDDPWWRTHFCPNGWGCRCRIMAVRAADYKGHPAPNDGTYQVTDRNGVTHTLPKGVDYGFDYAAGASLNPQFVTDKLSALPSELSAALNKDISKIRPKTFWDSTTEQAKWHDASFSNSPEWLKDSIANYDAGFGGLLPYDLKHPSAYYQRGIKKIHMATLTEDSLSSQGTWRHEFGHYVDNEMTGTVLEFRSSSADFKKAMKKDSDALMKVSGSKLKEFDDIETNVSSRKNLVDTVNQTIKSLDKNDIAAYLIAKSDALGIQLNDVYQFFERETIHVADTIGRDARIARLLQAIERKDAYLFMEAFNGGLDYAYKSAIYDKGLTGKFSDLVGSATKNKLLGQGEGGFGGHPDKYLKTRGNAETEVFANLTVLLGSDNPFWHKTVNTFYPTLTKLFMEIMSHEL